MIPVSMAQTARFNLMHFSIQDEFQPNSFLCSFCFLNHMVIFRIYFFPPFCSFLCLLFCIVNMFFLCFSILFLSTIQYLQMKWPLLDVQAGSLQSRQALKDARSPSPAHIVVSNTH